MLQFGTEDKNVCMEEKTLRMTMKMQGRSWSWSEDFRPYLLMKDQSRLYFDQANIQEHQKVKNGIGEGILSRYGSFPGLREEELELETYVWMELATGDVYFELIPIQEEAGQIEKIFWPGPMEFQKDSSRWYTVLPHGQGLLIPNNWKEPLPAFHFNGRFLTEDAYMPWFGQVKDGCGYIVIAETPWNGGIWADRSIEETWTKAGVWWEPSLGKIDYRRILKFRFLDDCDYNHLAKVYREYVNETGALVTLKEKAVKNPGVDKLIGAEFVHCGIKTSTNPKSDFYDQEHPEKNHHVTAFAVREEMLKKLHDLGAGKMYLHLDGWAEPGYDNRHPDYLPACEEAGGYDGMRRLAETLHELGGFFGIHDQYRDYYMDAPSYSEEYAVQNTDGSHPSHARWAGGPQSYLCATQAPFYVRRNFQELKAHDIPLDGAYLDVFTCNEGDECANPRHRMSRRECYEYRRKCFHWLSAQGILPSSEEVADWSVDSMVFCHYAPYDFMLQKPGTPKAGLPVPLFNLVYHDCMIIPWMMENHESEDYMLYALLNGGAPYLVRMGAYDGIDGSYGGVDYESKEHLERCRIVSELNQKIACCELVEHHFLNEDGSIQESVFSDGTRVKVDFLQDKFYIKAV